MEKVGIIDLGTNTFNLLIANVNGLNYKVLHKTKIAVKLGEGGIHKGFIAPEAYKRGLDALQVHKETLLNYQIHDYYAVATSAIRSSDNGTQFVEDVKQQLGIRINIIDGDKEADLICNGVKQAVDFNINPSFKTLRLLSCNVLPVEVISVIISDDPIKG